MENKHKVMKICPSEESFKDVKTNIKCPVPNCDKVVFTSGSLRMHLSRSHGICETQGDNALNTRTKMQQKVYTEYHCPAGGCIYNEKSERHFTTMANLKQHYMKVHAEKKFKCSKCGNGFGMDKDRRRHEGHCGMKFTCTTCQCTYISSEALLTHCYRTQHPVPEEYATCNRKKEDKKIKKSEEYRCEKLQDNVLAKESTPTNKLKIPVILLPVPSNSMAAIKHQFKLRPIKSKDTENTDYIDRSILSINNVAPKNQVHLHDHDYQINSYFSSQIDMNYSQDVIGQMEDARTKSLENDLVKQTVKFISSGIQTSITVPPKKKQKNSIAQTQTSSDNILEQAMASANIPIESSSVGTQVTPNEKQKLVDTETQVTPRLKTRRGHRSEQKFTRAGKFGSRKKLYTNLIGESTTLIHTQGTTVIQKENMESNTINETNLFNNNYFTTDTSPRTSAKYFPYTAEALYCGSPQTGSNNSHCLNNSSNTVSEGFQLPDTKRQMISTGSQNLALQAEKISTGSQYPPLQAEMISTGSQYFKMQADMISTGSQFPAMQTNMISTGSQFPALQANMISTGSQFTGMQAEMISTESQFSASQIEMMSAGSQFSSSPFSIGDRSRISEPNTETNLYLSQNIGVQTHPGDFQDFLLSQSDLNSNSRVGTNSVGINTDKRSSNSKFAEKTKLLNNKCVGSETAVFADSNIQTIVFDFLAGSPNPQTAVTNIQTQTVDLDLESLESLVSSIQTQTAQDYDLGMSSLDVETQTNSSSSANTQTFTPSEFSSYLSSNIETQTYDEFPDFIELLSSGTQTLDYGFFEDAPLSLINMETQTGMNERLLNFGTQTSVTEKTNYNTTDLCNGSSMTEGQTSLNKCQQSFHDNPLPNIDSTKPDDIGNFQNKYKSEQMEFLVSEVLEMIPIETESVTSNNMPFNKMQETGPTSITHDSSLIASSQGKEHNYLGTHVHHEVKMSISSKEDMFPVAPEEGELRHFDSAANCYTLSLNDVNRQTETGSKFSKETCINTSEKHTQMTPGLSTDTISLINNQSQTTLIGISTKGYIYNTDNHTQTYMYGQNDSNGYITTHTQTASGQILSIDSHTQTCSGRLSHELTNSQTQTTLQRLGMDSDLTDSHTQTTWKELNDLLTELDH